MPNHSVEIVKMYHAALREETLLRIRLSHQLDIAKLMVLAALFGIGNTGITSTKDITILLYLVPPVAFLFDMYLAYNFRMMHSIGQYIGEMIGRTLIPTLGQLPEGWRSWEDWVSQSKSQRIWDGIGRLVQFLFTVGASVFAIYLLALPLTSWYVIIVLLMLLGDMACIGFLQKFSGSYYV